MRTGGALTELYDEEQSAVEALYGELFWPLFVYARAALKSDEAALEAVQETFRFASAKPAALLTSTDPHIWLLLTLKYILQNRGRNRAELSRLLLADFGYTADPEARSVSALVPAREFLGDEDLTLLSRFVNEDRSFRKAAADTGVSVSECQLRFRRARRRLLSRTNPAKYLR